MSEHLSIHEVCELAKPWTLRLMIGDDVYTVKPWLLLHRAQLRASRMRRDLIGALIADLLTPALPVDRFEPWQLMNVLNAIFGYQAALIQPQPRSQRSKPRDAETAEHDELWGMVLAVNRALPSLSVAEIWSMREDVLCDVLHTYNEQMERMYASSGGSRSTRRDGESWTDAKGTKHTRIGSMQSLVAAFVNAGGVRGADPAAS